MERDEAIRKARRASLINEELAPTVEAIRNGDNWEIRFCDRSGRVIARVRLRDDGRCQFAA